MSEQMTLVLLGLTVFCTLISCGASVIAYIFSRRPASVEMAAAIDELMAVVEKMMIQQRKVKMTNVRHAVKNLDDNGEADRSNSVNNPEQPSSKVALINLARQKGYRL